MISTKAAMRKVLYILVALLFATGFFSSFNNDISAVPAAAQHHEQLSPETGIPSEGIKTEVTSHAFRLYTWDVSKKLLHPLLQLTLSKDKTHLLATTAFQQSDADLTSTPHYIRQHRLLI